MALDGPTLQDAGRKLFGWAGQPLGSSDRAAIKNPSRLALLEWLRMRNMENHGGSSHGIAAVVVNGGYAYHVSTAMPRSQLSQQLDGEGDLERNRLMKNKQNPTYLRLDDGVMRVRDEVQVDTIVGRLRYGSRSRRY